MLSLNKAKELKSAGLVWYPEVGDMVYLWTVDQVVIGCPTPSKVLLNRWTDPKPTAECIFAPSLSQLLAEIEKRDELVQIASRSGGGWLCGIGCGAKYFFADTPEGATAAALIWLMENKKEADV